MLPVILIAQFRASEDTAQNCLDQIRADLDALATKYGLELVGIDALPDDQEQCPDATAPCPDCDDPGIMEEISDFVSGVVSSVGDFFFPPITDPTEVNEDDNQLVQGTEEQVQQAEQGSQDQAQQAPVFTPEQPSPIESERWGLPDDDLANQCINLPPCTAPVAEEPTPAPMPEPTPEPEYDPPAPEPTTSYDPPASTPEPTYDPPAASNDSSPSYTDSGSSDSGSSYTDSGSSYDSGSSSSDSGSSGSNS